MYIEIGMYLDNRRCNKKIGHRGINSKYLRLYVGGSSRAARARKLRCRIGK